MTPTREELLKTAIYTGPHKVNSRSDNSNFVPTTSYLNLKKVFLKLKESKGNIVHVLGAPGTGKSTNIYQALKKTGLETCEVSSTLPSINTSPSQVFKILITDLKKNTGSTTKKEAYLKLAEYDVVLFADKFHDPHLIQDNLIGFSLWTRNNTLWPIIFYLICIKEYIQFHSEFQNMNLVFQTAWRLRLRGKKYDIFTQVGWLSRLLVKLLAYLFCVVEISYTPAETINIIKSHLKDIDREKIDNAIHKFGCRPRLILEYLEPP
ncbi:MAG: hypothetical protein KKF16_01515 [Euryarchaeota archaeon]|nr:hypothetical protein [Euryarchaeota archaeon]MBU4607641.1 hypothetical protein [Euryarchaeota archaeon]MBV1754216.1 hypothetical protein [Methanobacterium sp.]